MRAAPSRPILLLVLMALALGGALVWGLLGPGPEGLPVPPAASAAGGGEEDGAAPLASGPHAVDAGAAVEEAEVAPVRQQVESEEAPALVLRVVAAATDEPCPGAEVRIGDLVALRRHHEEVEGPPFHHVCQLAERHGRVLRADEEGLVRLAPIDSRQVAAVRHGELFATVILRPGTSGETRISLAADETLRLRVESAGVAAAGVPLTVFQGSKPDNGRRLWTGVTAPDGEARIEHFQLVRRTERSGKRFAAAFDFPVYHGAALRAPPGVEFDGRPAPTEAVVLRMPPTGSVAVIVTDRDDEPVRGRVGAALRVLRAKETPQPDLPLGKNHGKLRSERAAGEEAVLFPFVGLGLQLEVSAFIAADNTSWTGRTIHGPTRPGQLVTVRQEMRADVAMVSGRLLGPDGEPLDSGLRPRLQLVGQGRTVARARSRSLDADGGFVVSGWLRDVTGPFALEASAKREDGLSLGACVELERLVGGQCQDLGEISLSLLEPLVSGAVVDDCGEPVHRAQVSLQSLRVTSASSGKREWKSDAFASARTDPDGRFVLYGQARRDRLRLRASASGHVAVLSADVQPGAETTLVLERSGRLEGDVLLPEWLPSKAMSLTLRQPGGSRHKTTLRNRKGRAHFRYSRLAPGSYDAVFELRNMKRPVLVLPAVTVLPGDDGTKSRLRQVDLRSALFLYELRAVGADGAAVRSTRGSVLGQVMTTDGTWETVGFRWKSGKVRIVHTSPTMELTFLMRGRQRLRLTVEAGQRDIVMPAAAPVTLCLPGLRDVAVDGVRAYVSVAAIDTGLPSRLRAEDQWSTRTRTLSSSSLLGSTGAWYRAWPPMPSRSG